MPITNPSQGFQNPMTAVGDLIVGGIVVGGVATPTALPIGANTTFPGVVAGALAYVPNVFVRSFAAPFHIFP